MTFADGTSIYPIHEVLTAEEQEILIWAAIQANDVIEFSGSIGAAIDYLKEHQDVATAGRLNVIQYWIAYDADGFGEQLLRVARGRFSLN